MSFNVTDSQLTTYLEHEDCVWGENVLYSQQDI